MSKIIYLADIDNPKYSFFKDIEAELKKGNEVEVINDRAFDAQTLVEKCATADMLLFHHGGVYTDTAINFAMSLERIKQILQMVKCKKVCWFLDKVWFLNNSTIEDIAPLTDLILLNDDTWARRHKYENVKTLRCGTPDVKEGEENEKYKCLVSYYGEVFGFTEPYLKAMKKAFGRKFKVFSNVYGKELADLVKSSKFVFVPVQPNDEFYWSHKIYEILALGGCPIFPRLYGLQDEGFVSGEHYLGYKHPQEIKAMVEGTEDTSDIIKAGKKLVKKYTYANRVKELLKLCNQQSVSAKV